METKIEGLRVIYSPNTSGFHDVVKTRTWKQRLTELPWRPWRSTGIYKELHPEIYIINLPRTESYRPLGGGVPFEQVILAHSSFQKDIEEGGLAFDEIKEFIGDAKQ